jgi:hypothetical protein
VDSIDRIACRGWIGHNSPDRLPAKPDQDETPAPWWAYMLIAASTYLSGVGIGFWYELTGRGLHFTVSF